MKRAYNNSVRAEKSNDNRQKIIDTYVELLVEKKGDEISLDELAARAGFSTRTLFRFFGDKKSLTRALDTYLEKTIQKFPENIDELSLDEFTKLAFHAFGKYENLMLAYVYTNFGQKSRVTFRKKANAILLEKIKKLIKLKNTVEEQNKLQLIITLINANVWKDLKIVYNQSGPDAGKSVLWAVNTLIKNL